LAGRERLRKKGEKSEDNRGGLSSHKLEFVLSGGKLEALACYGVAEAVADDDELSVKP
jgi:hypothetical protein